MSWSLAAILAFQQLKECFAMAPILHHTNPNLPFEVEVDASSSGLGPILSQRQGNPPKLYHTGTRTTKAIRCQDNFNPTPLIRLLKRMGHLYRNCTNQCSEPSSRNVLLIKSSSLLRLGITSLNKFIVCHHLVTTPTIHFTQNRFWWPTLNTDITQYVKQCRTCNMHKPSHQLPAGLLRPLPLPQRPWSHIAIDFITVFQSSNNCTTILTIIDRFSKACRLLPLPKLPTALQTAKHLCNWVFRLYGLPEDILSDRGPQFTFRLWSALFQALNVNVTQTSGYHPQSNGQVERLNQELTRFLRSYCNQQQNDWARYLQWAEYAQNSLRKEPQDSLLSNEYWVINPLSSLGQGSPPMSQLSTNGSLEVRRSGTRPIPTCSMPYAAKKSRLIPIAEQVQSTNQANGFFYQHEIYDSDSHARSYAQGT